MAQKAGFFPKERQGKAAGLAGKQGGKVGKSEASPETEVLKSQVWSEEESKLELLGKKGMCDRAETPTLLINTGRDLRAAGRLLPSL